MRSENSHLLTVTTVSVCTSYLILSYAIFSSESLLETCRVECSERSKLVWLKTRVDKSCESCNVSRVEDNYNVLNVWAVLLDVITEVSSDLTVAYEKVLTCHAVLTWSTT